MLTALALAAALAGAQPPAAAAPPAPSPSGMAPAPAGPPWLFPGSAHVVRPRISVEVVGAGPDLVLIPGLASSRETWRRTAERLRGRYRLHLVQVAGFAGEPARDNAQGPDGSPVLAPTMEDVDGYLHAARLAPAVIVGHSLGGTLALQLAQAHPADVKRLVLVDALPFYGVLMGGPQATADSLRPAAAAMRARVSQGPVNPAVGRKMIGAMVTAPDDVDRVLGWSMASDRAVEGQALSEDITLDLRPGLAAVRAPVTLIYPFDPAMGVPQPQWDALYRGQYAPLAGARLVQVAPSRHFVMYDQPARFDAALDQALAGG